MSLTPLPYKQSIQNRPENPPYYMYDYDDFGLIKPEEDPGLNEKMGLEPEQKKRLDEDAKKDTAGFKENFHLPKGVFDPTGREYDSSKKDLVINYTEDDHPSNFLAALDNYFKLDIPEVNSIKEKFNVFVAWSTSLEDAMKTLQVVSNKIGDLTKASVLFLNDLNFHMGTGPNFTLFDYKDLNSRGFHITDLASKLFNLASDKTRTFFQTSDRRQWTLGDSSADPTFWETDDSEAMNNLITEHSSLFSRRTGIALGKLDYAIEDEKVSGVRVPIQSFIKYLESKEG